MTDPGPAADPAPQRQGARGRRDRRGRGLRGPAVRPAGPGERRSPVPGPRTTPRDRFDHAVLEVAADLEGRWGRRLVSLEYAVEEVPRLPDGWHGDQVPLAALVRAAGGRPARVVVFRRPVEHRAADREDLRALVRAVVVEQVAELLGLDPDEVDPAGADDPDLPD